MKRRPAPRLLALGLAAALAGPAAAQSRNDSPLLLELLDRVEQLEQETRQLRGDIEVLRYQLEQSQQQSQRPGAAPPPAGTPPAPKPPAAVPAPTAPAPATVPPASTPVPPAAAPAPTVPAAPAAPAAGAAGGQQESYDAAVKLLREGRYEQAATALQDFLHRFPGGPLAGNAQYWLGENYYVMRDFARARDAFIQFGASYPNSERVPEALLKLGYCYDELGDAAKAREVLRRLTQAYPGTNAAAQAERRLQQLR